MKVTKIKEKATELIHRNDFKQYFANTVWLFLEHSVQLIAGFFVGIWVMRYLGPEDYGTLSFAISFIAIFSAIGSLGIDSILIKELVRNKERHNTLLGTSFFICTVGSILLIFLIFISLIFYKLSSSTITIVIIVALGNISNGIKVFDLYFQSQVLSKYTFYAKTISLLILSSLKIYFILTEMPLPYFAVLFAVDTFLMAPSLIFFYSKIKGSIFKWNFSRHLFFRMLSESWPLILSGLSISLALRIDQVMINNYLNLESVGIYAAGVKLAEIFLFLPVLIGKSFYPKIIELDLIKEQHKIIYLIGGGFFMLLLISILVGFFAPFAVKILYGAAYFESDIVTSILIFTVPLTYLGIITSNLLLKQGDTKFIFIRQLCLAFLNVFFNLSLIPSFGFIGAAWATLIADFLVNFFFELFIPNRRWLFYLKLKALTFNLF